MCVYSCLKLLSNRPKQFTDNKIHVQIRNLHGVEHGFQLNMSIEGHTWLLEVTYCQPQHYSSFCPNNVSNVVKDKQEFLSVSVSFLHFYVILDEIINGIIETMVQTTPHYHSK